MSGNIVYNDHGADVAYITNQLKTLSILFSLLFQNVSRLRHGRAGGSWRHVKEVLQAGGSRIVFVDGMSCT